MTLNCYSIHESEILAPKLFIQKNKTLRFPAQCSHHQARLTFSDSPDSFFLHSNAASTGGEEKNCGKENSAANLCDVQPPR